MAQPGGHVKNKKKVEILHPVNFVNIVHLKF